MVECVVLVMPPETVVETSTSAEVLTVALAELELELVPEPSTQKCVE